MMADLVLCTTIVQSGCMSFLRAVLSTDTDQRQRTETVYIVDNRVSLWIALPDPIISKKYWILNTTLSRWTQWFLCFHLKSLKNRKNIIFFHFLTALFCPKNVRDCLKNIVLFDLGWGLQPLIPLPLSSYIYLHLCAWEAFVFSLLTDSLVGLHDWSLVFGVIFSCHLFCINFTRHLIVYKARDNPP